MNSYKFSSMDIDEEVNNVSPNTQTSLMKQYKKGTESQHDSRNQMEEIRFVYMKLQHKMDVREKQSRNRQETVKTQLQKCKKSNTQYINIPGTLEKTEESAAQITSNSSIKNLEKKVEDLETREQNLLASLNVMTINEIQLKQQLTSAQKNFTNLANSSVKREKELTDEIKNISTKLHDNQQRQKCRRSKFADNLKCEHSAKNAMQEQRIKSLTSDIESLRAVLDIKHHQIAALKHKNENLEQKADQIVPLKSKICALNRRVEDLQIQIKQKIDEETELIQKTSNLQKSFSQEVETTKRIKCHNEELKWRLNELKKVLSPKRDSFMPPHQEIEGVLTPVAVKEVVEKNDSVSWVLEVGDSATPKSRTTRLMEKASNLKTNITEKLCGVKKQLFASSGVSKPSKNVVPPAENVNLIAFRTRSKSAIVKSPTVLDKKKTLRRSSAIYKKN